jgi:predicted ATPase
MEQAVTLYDAQRHRSHSFMYGQDPGVACKAFGAVALWLLGHPDEAVRQSDAAVRLSHDLAQPSSQALALHFAAMLHQCRRDPRRALACAETASSIAQEHGFSFWSAGGAVLGGWALAASDPAEGLARLRRGLAEWRATGSGTYFTYFLGLQAEILAQQDHHAEARRVLDEALMLVRQTGEGLYEGELHRLAGECLLADSGRLADGHAAVEKHFREALSIARRQEARSLELRAALSLWRLQHKTGKGGDAAGIVADVLGHFQDGFDTPDLQEAKRALGHTDS